LPQLTQGLRLRPPGTASGKRLKREGKVPWRVRDRCTGEREALARPPRRTPHAHPAPAHKFFADRNSLYQEITDKIIAELEQGRAPRVQLLGGVTAPLGLPRNAATGRSYSGIKILTAASPNT
jgi:N-terminal domain of anti-restriction factor ArdC